MQTKTSGDIGYNGFTHAEDYNLNAATYINIEVLNLYCNPSSIFISNIGNHS